MDMESDFDRLLTSNEPPSVEALQKAHQLLADTQLEIQETEAQISTLTARLSSLKARSSRYETVTSPFRRIPTDILHEIFYQCLSSYRNPLLTASEAPVLLTRICSRWRIVALSSSRLWSQMHITFCNQSRDLNHMPNHDPDGLLSREIERRRREALQLFNLRCEVVCEWLTRAGTCPLSISVFYSSPGHNLDDTRAEFEGNRNATLRLLQILAQSLPRCRRFEWSVPLDVYQQLDVMIADQAIDLRALKALSIFHHLPTPFNDWNLVKLKDNLLSKASRLERLSLNGQGPTFSDFLLNLASRGENLTHLCCNMYLPARENLDILKHCKNLVHCKISVRSHVHPGGGLTEDTSSTAVVFLPFLSSLSILEDPSVWSVHISVRQLYSLINAPRLKWINYDNKPYYRGMTFMSDGGDSNLISPILPLLQKSIQLTKLSLDPRDFLPRDLKKIFEVVSLTLVHLVFGNEASLRQPANEHGSWMHGSQNCDFLSWLLVESESNSKPPLDSTTTLLPCLQAFESCPGLEPDESLLRFITSRLTASFSFPEKVAPLRLVRVRYNRTKQLDVEQELAPFLRSNNTTGAGLQLDLSYLPQLSRYVDPLSSSYGVDENEQYWKSSETNEMYMPE